MTEFLNTGAIIPRWVIILSASILISWMGFSAIQLRAQENLSTRMDAVEKVVDSKADKNDIVWIKESLKRIESNQNKP